MRRSWTRISLLAVALSMGTTAALRAEEGGPPIPPDSAMCAALPAAERVQVLVELVDTPALGVYQASLAASVLTDPAQKEAAARAAEHAQDRRIKEAQASLLPELAELGARELYRVRRSFNGIAVVVGPDKLAALRALPGVKAIYPRTEGRPDGPAPRPVAAAGPSESKQSPQPADTTVPATAGLRAYLDPNGRLTSTPTESQVRELDRMLGESVNRSSEGLEVVTHFDGSEVLFLQGRFQSFSTATLSPGGGVTLRCNEHAVSGSPRPSAPSAAVENQ